MHKGRAFYLWFFEPELQLYLKLLARPGHRLSVFVISLNRCFHASVGIEMFIDVVGS